MKTALRLSWCLLSSLLFQAAILPLFLLGWIVVPIALPWATLRPSRVDPAKWTTQLPSWAWLWSNDEDGVNPPWWRIARPSWTWWRQAIVWSCWRNSVNNLRFIKAISPPPVRDNIRFQMGQRWALVWQGWASRFTWYFANGKLLRIGWKYEIMDGVVLCTDWRRFGVGFGIRVVGP